MGPNTVWNNTPMASSCGTFETPVD